MHFALVTHSLPQPSSNGGPMTCWAIVKSLLAAKHRVTIVSLSYPGDDFNTSARRETLLALGAELAQIDTVNSHHRSAASSSGRGNKLWKIQEIIKPEISTFFPTANLKPYVKAHLEQMAPDAVFVYHWDSLAATYGLHVAPRMVGVGDPWHLPSLRGWQQARPRLTLPYLLWTLSIFRESFYCPKFMVKLLNECEASGCFQADAAAWLRKNGASHCAYLRSPVADSCGDGWQQLRKGASKGNKPRILLGPSNLNATSTSAGIRLFATEILPHLERELGPEGFEVRVVGEGEPPPELAKLLPRPSVKLCGRIEPADPEFLAADIQLAPTPFVLGIRVRIITGFSFGCCVVAHTNDGLNIPEMVHEQNSLLAADGHGLAEAIIRAIRDRALRERLGANARQTYEQYFAPEVASEPIVAELERLGSRQKLKV